MSCLVPREALSWPCLFFQLSPMFDDNEFYAHLGCAQGDWSTKAAAVGSDQIPAKRIIFTVY